MMLQRRIYAVLLLLVVLPTVLFAPFHHHDEKLSFDDCEACLHHEPHQGHLSENHSTDECLVCQVLCQQYVPSGEVVIRLLSSESVTVSDAGANDICILSYQPSSSRAPPVSFRI